MDISKLSTYQLGLVHAQAYRVLQLEFRTGLEPYGLSIPEWSLMGVVYDTDNMTLTQIADALRSKASHPTVLVEQLMERGLLSRTSHPDDRRVRVVTLTAKGRSLVPKIESSVRASIRDAVNHIPREELATYFGVLAQLAKKGGV